MWQLEHPEFLHLLWLLFPLWMVFAGFRRFYMDAARHLGHPDISGRNGGLKIMRWGIPAIICIIIAIANPQRHEPDGFEKTRHIDVVLILDVSNSMLAHDVSPNRLEQARAFSLALAGGLRGSRMALVMMAGNAWVQIPMTTDLEAVAMSIRSADPSLALQQGTNMAGAFALAKQIVTDVSDDKSGKAVVLVSDGENHEAALGAALRGLKKAKTLTWAVGVGTEQGGFIPLESTETGAVKHGPDGKPVRTRLEASALKQITSGRYYELDAFNIRQTATIVAGKILEMGSPGTVLHQQASFQSFFQVFLCAALVFLLLGLWWEKRAERHHY